jgi:hypothetical protein
VAGEVWHALPIGELLPFTFKEINLRLDNQTPTSPLRTNTASLYAASGQSTELSYGAAPSSTMDVYDVEGDALNVRFLHVRLAFPSFFARACALTSNRQIPRAPTS